MSDNSKKHHFSAALRLIEQRNTCWLVGLDPVPDQMPERYRNGDNSSQTSTGLTRSLSALLPSIAAYKPNIAFYEALGPDGYTLLRRTIDADPARLSHHPRR